MRTHSGLAAGPAEWLLVFLEVERAELAARRGAERPGRARPEQTLPERALPERTPSEQTRPDRPVQPERPERAAPLRSRRGRPEESPFGRLNARSA